MTRGFGVEIPSSAPNFNQRQVPTTPDMELIEASVWWDNAGSGTVVDVRWSEGVQSKNALTPGVALRWARNTWEMSQMGLRPTLQALGVESETYRPPEDPNSVGYFLRTPPTTTLIDRANALQYPETFGRRMRFEATDEALYHIDHFFEALQEGRMLVSMGGFDPWLNFHDVTDHLFVGLALSGELVDALSNAARRLMTQPETLQGFDEKGAEGLKSEFLGRFDRRVYGTSYLSLLRGDEDELALWADMLATDVETVRGYAARANAQLRELRPIPEWQPPRQRTGRLAGWLSLRKR